MIPKKFEKRTIKSRACVPLTVVILPLQSLYLLGFNLTCMLLQQILNNKKYWQERQNVLFIEGSKKPGSEEPLADGRR
jgi:hypothetical protein